MIRDLVVQIDVTIEPCHMTVEEVMIGTHDREIGTTLKQALPPATLQLNERLALVKAFPENHVVCHHHNIPQLT